jgi:hypothetical protein
VLFLASWVRSAEAAVVLVPDNNGLIWRGRATNVPANFPPHDYPHAVSVNDPHLRHEPSRGATASRLRVGGEAIRVIDSEGTPLEAGLIFIDENGRGHNPF